MTQYVAPQPGQNAAPDGIDAPVTAYEARGQVFAAQRDHYAARSARMANVNLALFTGALICLGIGVWQGEALWYLGAGLLALGFVAAYAYHTAIDRHHHHFNELWTITNEGLLRIRRDWQALPLRQAPEPPDMALAADLDLLGHASLQHLLNTAYTPIGQITLQRWLLQPAAPPVVRARQGAVQQLAPLLDFRDQLALRGRSMGTAQTNYERFLDWSEDAGWLSARPWLVWLSRFLTLLTFAAIGLQIAGLTPYPLWVGCIVVNLLLVLTIGGRVDEVIDRVAARQIVFRTYTDLFQLISAQPFTDPELQRLQARLTAQGQRADHHMRRLTRIMALAELRHFMFYLPIQLMTLWNFHVLWLLERWQATAGCHVRDWLAALGELEALSALAALAHDHPSWTFPTLQTAGQPCYSARSLGHALLPPASRVDNDVRIGPPGTFLLVTGSNMSGKSTLLRAVGLSVVLAQAGGPVCAGDLQLPPITLATSMRVQDSLERGVSYFMAEIQRLKAVVDLAEQTRAAGQRTLLYLLDEILHGTNTGERQIAARRIIRHLLNQGALGAVSTHDLALGDAPELAAAAQLVHFTETFARGPEGPVMHFDYRLRPGIATSTNALKLMELVGLPLDADTAAASR